MKIRRILKGAASLAFALLLSACVAAIEDTVGECEPGVEDISQIATAVPMPTC